MLTLIFSHLYPFVMLVTLSGHIPQMRLLLKATQPVKDISLKTWCLWVCSNGIAVGYGYTCLHDRLFCASATMSFILVSTMAVLVFHNKHVRFRKGDRLSWAREIVSRSRLDVPRGDVPAVAAAVQNTQSAG